MSLPKEFTAPVICRIKGTVYKNGLKHYILEPVVLPERTEDGSQVRVPEVREAVREKE